MASGIGASRGEYTIDGVVAVSQVRPRPERRGGAGDVGGSVNLVSENSAFYGIL